MEVKEYGVPDIVKSMCWCGENICMGIRRGYVILNTTNGVVSEVFPPGRTAPPLVVPLSPGEILLGKVLYTLNHVDYFVGLSLIPGRLLLLISVPMLYSCHFLSG